MSNPKTDPDSPNQKPEIRHMGIITSLAQVVGEDIKESTNPEHPDSQGTPGESFHHEK